MLLAYRGDECDKEVCMLCLYHHVIVSCTCIVPVALYHDLHCSGMDQVPRKRWKESKALIPCDWHAYIYNTLRHSSALSRIEKTRPICGLPRRLWIAFLCCHGPARQVLNGITLSRHMLFTNFFLSSSQIPSQSLKGCI